MDLPCADDGKARTLATLLEGIPCKLPSDASDKAHDYPQGYPIARLVSLTSAREAGDLCFFGDPKLFSYLLALPSDVLCLISKDHAQLARARGVKAVLVEVEDAKQTWRLMVEKLLPDDPPHEQAIHPTAIVGAGAVLHEPVSIGAYSVIEDGVEIGAGTRIESHCLVRADTRTGTRTGRRTCTHLGKRCRVGAGSVIANAWLADGVVVHEHCIIGGKEFGVMRDEQNIPRTFPQLGRVVIGAYSEIFKSTTIGRGALEDTRIGSFVKIGCLSLISHNCDVGDYTILSPRCTLSGATRIGRYMTAGGGMTTGQGVEIGDRVGVGGKCTFWPNISVGDGVQIMNGSFVERSLRGEGVVFFGRPARPMREELRRRKKIDRLTR